MKEYIKLPMLLIALISFLISVTAGVLLVVSVFRDIKEIDDESAANITITDNK